MKKIVLVLVIIMGVFIAIGATFIIKNRKYEIKVTSYDDAVVLDLGKYKCTDFSKSDDYSPITYITFKVKDKNHFYDSIIKKSDCFIPELAYEKDDEISGYLLKENSYFYYKIKDSYIKISSVASPINAEEGRYFVIADFVIGYHNNIKENKCWVWRNENCSFSDLLLFYDKLDNKFYKIEDNVIYLKGHYSDGELFDEYAVKIYKSDSIIMVELLIS